MAYSYIILYYILLFKNTFINCSYPYEDPEESTSTGIKRPSGNNEESELPRKILKNDIHFQEQRDTISNYEFIERKVRQHEIWRRIHKCMENIACQLKFSEIYSEENQQRCRKAIEERTPSKKRIKKAKHLELPIKKSPESTLLNVPIDNTNDDYMEIFEKINSTEKRNFDEKDFFLNLYELSPNFCNFLLNIEQHSKIYEKVLYTKNRENIYRETKTTEEMKKITLSSEIPTHMHDLNAESNSIEVLHDSTKFFSTDDNDANKITDDAYFVFQIYHLMNEKNISEVFLRHITDTYTHNTLLYMYKVSIILNNVYGLQNESLDKMFRKLADTKYSDLFSNDCSNVSNILKSLPLLKFFLYKLLVIKNRLNDPFEFFTSQGNQDCYAHLRNHSNMSGIFSFPEEYEFLKNQILVQTQCNTMLQELLLHEHGINFSEILESSDSSLTIEDISDSQLKEIHRYKTFLKYMVNTLSSIKIKSWNYIVRLVTLENSTTAVVLPILVNIGCTIEKELSNLIDNIETVQHTNLKDIKFECNDLSILQVLLQKMQATILQKDLYRTKDIVDYMRNNASVVNEFNEFLKHLERLIEKTNSANHLKTKVNSPPKMNALVRVKMFYLIMEYVITQMILVHIKNIKALYLDLYIDTEHLNPEKFVTISLTNHLEIIISELNLIKEFIKGVDYVLTLIANTIYSKSAFKQLDEISEDLCKIFMKNKKNQTSLSQWLKEATPFLNKAHDTLKNISIKLTIENI